MKWFFQMGVRLFLTLLMFAGLFLITFLILNLLFIVLLYVILDLEWDFRQWQMSLLIIWASLFFIGYVFFITMPLIHIIQWVIGLARGQYTEPTFRFSHTKWFTLSSGLYRELVQHMRSLTQALMESEKTRQQIKEKRSEWIAGIQHDLKTPLAYIKGYASMINASDQWSRDEIKQFAQKIEEKTDAIEKLIHDLSVAEELEKEKFPFVLKPVHIIRLVKETVIDIANTPDAMSYSFSFQSDSSSSLVANVHPQLLQRSLQNILTNAFLHNPEGTTIVTTVKERNDQIEITVADDGNGMDPETLNHLFQKYHRGNAQHSVNGTGLGLALTKNWIELQGGTIEADSRPGKGTIITIHLPKTK